MEQVTIRGLQQFLAVVENRSFTRAADKLLVSQPWLSAKVTQLERMFGRPLLERRRDGVYPTNLGRAVVDQAGVVCNEYFKLMELTTDLADADNCPIRLGGCYDCLALPRRALIIDYLGRNFPDARVEVHHAADPAVRQALKHNELDLGIVFGSPPEDLKSIPLASGTLEFLMPADHRLAAFSAIPLAELRGERALVWRRDVAPELWDLSVGVLQTIGMEIEIAPEPTRKAQVDWAAKTGLPTVLLSILAPDAIPEGHVVRQLAGDAIPVVAHLVHSPEAGRRPSVRSLWQMVRNWNHGSEASCRATLPGAVAA